MTLLYMYTMFLVWVLLNCTPFDYSVIPCPVLYFPLSKILLYIAQCTVLELHITLWSMRIVWQQSKNSVAAQPLIGIKATPPKQFTVNCGCDKLVEQATSVLPPRAERRMKAECFNINLLM